MIDLLAAPLVCVIDEDPNEYPYILQALNSLYVGCVHIKGDDTTQLPPQPFKSLRLVFTDLYLSSGAVGKDMASHTANVFRHVVSADTGPVLVVIWSKHKDETVDAGVPEEDQKTEADLFKETLIEAFPEYKEKLVFLEMQKPMAVEDKEAWVAELRGQINNVLAGRNAIHVIWEWESLVRGASQGVIGELASSVQLSGIALEDGLQKAMRLIVAAQSEGGVSEKTAPGYLATVLAQMLVDQLEHFNGGSILSSHGPWLVEPQQATNLDAFKFGMNSFLLTAKAQTSATLFLPGMIYKVSHHEKFKELFGIECFEFLWELFKKDNNGVSREEWLRLAELVLIEISPSCDIDQGSRLNAFFMAGLILPARAKKNTKTGGAFETLPVFFLRWSADGFAAQDSLLTFCTRYRVTLPSRAVPAELIPWFRLRELPTASLRNWHAGEASRVGYVSLS